MGRALRGDAAPAPAASTPLASSSPSGPEVSNAATPQANGDGGAFSSSTANANSSIPSAPSVSLPKGGGAIQGMGEKFDVNSNTGTASNSFPVHVSPGRAGMSPQLSLNYDSGGGNGEFGLGWHLAGWQSITRKTSRGLPKYNDTGFDADSDVYLLSGLEDLVPLFKRDTSGNVSMNSAGSPVMDESSIEGYTVRRYDPRITQTFSRIERWTNVADPDDVHWRVITAQNITTILGTSNSSRIYDPQSGTNGPLRIFSWLEAEVYDPHGNAMIFNYKPEDSFNVPLLQANETTRTATSRSANRYLKSIQYGNVAPNRVVTNWAAISASTLPQETWKFSVVLDYGEHDLENPKPDDSGSWSCRLDPFSRYQPGYEVRTYRLCQRILMFHHFTELGTKDFLVASTDFTYTENPTVSYLTSVQRAGYAASATGAAPLKKVLPPLQFEYSLFPTYQELGQLLVQEIDKESLQNLPVGLDGTNYQWVDLDGEGLSGILTEQDQSWYYKRNTSATNYGSNVSNVNPDSIDYGIVHARFTKLELVPSRPSFSGQGTHFEDVAGAGKLDVIQTFGPAWGYFERNDDEKAGWDQFRPFMSFPNLDIATLGADIKFVDLSGDGLADILIYSDQVYCWYPSLGTDGYGPPQMLTQPRDETSGPVCVFSDAEQTIFVADMSGDGLSDIVRIRRSDVSYWPNCGYGRFGSIVWMDNAPLFDRYNSFRWNFIRLADIDGSGTTDILYLGAEGIDIYLNQSGNGFDDRMRLTSLPPIDGTTTTVNTVDLLGNGTTCIVWSSPLLWATTSPLQYVDLTQGKKPHLLTKMVNNLGMETKISYAPSTKFYLQDKEKGTPWITRLPFPVQCVERVETMDSIGMNRFVKSYSYSHGYFDGVEREFRGFARVEQWDTDNFAALSKVDSANIDASWHVPPAHTKTWFHTGAFVNSESLSRQLALEYFGAPTGGTDQEMSNFYNSLLPDSVIQSSSLEADSLREAYRALKGHTLRTEIYADDGSPLASIPYTVHESNFTIEVLQPLQDAHIHSIYTVRPRETINYNYEREIEDPRIDHEMILQLDSYGNVLKRLQIAYGRQQGKSQLTGLDKTKQETTYFLYSEQDVTKLLDTQSDYRIPTQYEIRAYELSGFRLPTGTTRFPLSSFDSNNFLPLTSLPEIPYESKNDANALQKRLLQQHRILFRNDDLSGILPAGEVQSLAVPGAEYTLWATPGLLANIFKRQVSNQPIENLIPDPKSMLGGIGDQQGGYVDLDNNGSWWQVSGKVFFHLDPTVAAAQELAEAQSSFFQPRAFLDPFGNKKTVNYDPYNLFTVSSQDAVGNSTTAVIDYRVLAPTLLTDPNGNQTAVKFDALGMVAGNIIMGQPGQKAGDSFDNFKTDLVQADIDNFFADPNGPTATTLLGTATSRIVVDQTCFWHNNLPTYQALISRETHVNDLGAGEITKIQVTLTYSDGFGQAIQTKTQTKAGPLTDEGTNISSRWISSSWKIFNNKGKTVRQYEPFFDDTHEFKFAIKVGVSPIMMYDPLSRLVATLNQDHSLEKVVFDPWSHTTYDASDNVKISNPKSDADVGHFFDSLPEYEYLPSWYDARIGGQLGPYEKTAAIKTQAHANTPHVTHLDPLEHVILAIDDNGQGDLHYTRFSYDVQGHQLNSTDALNRLVVTCDYSIAGSKIHAATMEAGETWTLPNVLGQDFMLWNSRNFCFRSSYDAARRLTEQWVRDGGAVEVMVQQNVYGELVPNASLHNLRGRIFKSRDQAGEITSNDFDFKGNASSASRLLASNYRDTLDWSTSVDLEPSLLTSMYTYDALNRIVKSIATDASTSYRYYNEGGYTEQLFVNVRGEQASTDPTSWTPVFTQVEHNAKNQLTKIFHGNGIIIQRSYEPLFSHLSRIQTTRTSDGSVLQDLNYTFDAVGNVSRVGDNAQQTVYFRNNRVDPSSEFTYDPLFRLISATGREHLGQTNGTANAPVAPSAMDTTSVISPTDGNAMGSYSETYVYDAVGNMLSLSHAGSDPQNPGWKRVYLYNESSQLEPAKKSNRLSATTVGSISENYKYDDHGNVISMPYLPSMQWDFQNQLRSTSKQIVINGGTPETTYYVYDSKGKRIRKVTESQAGPGSAPVPVRTKERIYLGSLDIFRTFTSNGTDIDLELVDLESRSESGRVAIIETRTSGSSPAPLRVIRFQYGNFIGSASLELDQEARIITYEEYFPFGASAYRSVASQNNVPNRYRYSGKEKDDENGLYYYGARYYASWLGRWVSTDPGGFVDGPNLYEFVKCNPITLQDPDGREWGVGGGVGAPAPGTPPPGILAGQGLKDLAIEEVEKGVVKTTVRTVATETGEAIAPRVLPATGRILSVGGGALLAGLLAGAFVFFRNESHELSPSEERKYLEEDRRRERLKLPGPDNLPDHTGPVPAPAPDPQLLPPHESPPPGPPVVPEHRDPIDVQEHRRPVEKIKEKLPEKERDKPRRKKRDDDWVADWHHSIPQNHLDDFKDIVNINDKAEGRVLPLWYHKLITPGLTKDWDQFVIDHTVDGKFEGTEKDIKDFQKKMDRKWKTGLFQRTPWNFYSPQQSRVALTEWVKRHGWLRTGN